MLSDERLERPEDYPRITQISPIHPNNKGHRRKAPLSFVVCVIVVIHGSSFLGLAIPRSELNR